MALSVFNAGAYKGVRTLYVFNAGAYKAVRALWVFDAGVWRAVIAAIAAPASTPGTPSASGLAGSVIRLQWANTDPTQTVEAEFYRSGVLYAGATYPAGTTQADQQYTAGDTGSGRVRYYNSAGVGPWSAISNAVTATSGGGGVV